MLSCCAVWVMIRICLYLFIVVAGYLLLFEVWVRFLVLVFRNFCVCLGRCL